MGRQPSNQNHVYPKMLPTLLQGLNAEGVQLYVAELRSSFLEAAAAPGAEAAIDKGRTWAVEQLCGAVQLPAASATVKLEALHFLATHAFFVVQAKHKSKASFNSNYTVSQSALEQDLQMPV